MKLDIRFFFTILTVAFFVAMAGCVPNFPAIHENYVSKVTLECDNAFTCGHYAISPNGQYLTSNLPGWIDINTGEQSIPYRNYDGMPQNQYIGISLRNGWSPDGRYYAFSTSYPDTDLQVVRHPVYINDTHLNTTRKLDNSVEDFRFWSPFNTERFLAFSAKSNWSVYTLDGSKFTNLDEEVDFRQETDFGGTNDLLWSKKLDRPVAKIEIVPILSEEVHETGIQITGLEFKKQTGKFKLYINSFSNPREPFTQFSPLYRMAIAENPPLSNLINAIFDPTGKYILLEQWECLDSTLKGCSSDFLSFDTTNVKDTIFTLINWQTGEKQEIYRISTLDSENTVGTYPLIWSSDGSTIVVGRYNASSVVLKVKYP